MINRTMPAIKPAEMKSNILSGLSETELNEIVAEFKEDIYCLGFGEIANKFLRRVLAVGTYDDFEDIKKRYLSESKENPENIGDNQRQFEIHICNKYFKLHKEPCKEYASAIGVACKQVLEINERIARINAEIEQIRSSGSTDDKHNRLPLLYYYKEGNERAREQIEKFILTGAKDYAINLCQETYKGLYELWARIPYDYAWGPEAYEVREVHPLDNKGLGHDEDNHYALKKLYDTDKEQFNSYLKNYIQEHGIIFSIRERVQENNILFQRSIIIEQSLRAYESGLDATFTISAITQIEGIIHQICIEIGVDEEKLKAEGYAFKIKQLLKVLKLEFYYEYYAFYLRILRNKIAHGIATAEEIKESADLVLIDLYQIGELASSDNIPSNKKRIRVEIICANKPGESCWWEMVEYLLLDGVIIPKHYNMEEKIKKAEAQFCESEFTNLLEKMVDRIPLFPLSPEMEHKLKGAYAWILTALKKRNWNTPKAIEILKKLNYAGPVSKPESVDETITLMKAR